MSNRLQTAVKVSAIALVMLLTSGCAAELQRQVDEMNAKMDRIAADASAAQSAADAATAAASEGLQMASGAQSTAKQALNAANQAQACCDATNEKIDRAFQRSQYK